MSRPFSRFVQYCTLVILALSLNACATRFSTPNASGRYVARPVQCVPYAREQSGVSIYGDAYTWWNQAAPRYAQGSWPQPGAVLVLAQTDRMQHGHLAVVKNIVNPREIYVTHSNWGNDWKTRRAIYESMRVQDVSAMNDWSSVRFWNKDVNQYGFPYAAKGFIYR